MRQRKSRVRARRDCHTSPKKRRLHGHTWWSAAAPCTIITGECPKVSGLGSCGSRDRTPGHESHPWRAWSTASGRQSARRRRDVAHRLDCWRPDKRANSKPAKSGFDAPPKRGRIHPRALSHGGISPDCCLAPKPGNAPRHKLLIATEN